MKKWETLNKFKVQSSKFKIEELIDILLENRGITTKREREEFLHPTLETVTPETVGIDAKELKKALTRIVKAMEKKEQIVVFGDYDVDGITGSAILWETLHHMGAKVTPYIPHRVDEGYGLSIVGIENVKKQLPAVSLIITTDNGIVARDAVAFANKEKIDVIITDHHTVDDKLPDAYAIVHTTKLCGAGVVYLLSKEIRNVIARSETTKQSQTRSPRFARDDSLEDTHLELATLGTVADLVPLTGANRTIVRHGLSKLAGSKRLGLQALYKQAGIQKETFSPYEIGYIIGPRLNASGRVESAMDSLRLLCTTNRERAEELAAKLEVTNKERQFMLKDSKQHAIAVVNARSTVGKLLIVADASYAQGIIGLIAGKLVEEFYRPAIVLSIGETHSKASVRSVSGFNIIEFLRMHADHFVNVGGHPMAAGFTIETSKLTALQEMLEKKAEEILTDDLLIKTVKIDCELPFSAITKEVYDGIQRLSPFGMGNPEPVFATKGVTVDDIRIMGKEGTHLKLTLSQSVISNDSERSRDFSTSSRNDKRSVSFEAVGFGMGALAVEIHKGDTISVAYAIDENTWNGNTKLQLKIKDVVIS
jgi:single-stranded-DNA-specific exonuclease